jgi:hypothetical protein
MSHTSSVRIFLCAFVGTVIVLLTTVLLPSAILLRNALDAETLKNALSEDDFAEQFENSAALRFSQVLEQGRMQLQSEPDITIRANTQRSIEVLQEGVQGRGENASVFVGERIRDSIKSLARPVTDQALQILGPSEERVLQRLVFATDSADLQTFLIELFKRRLEGLPVCSDEQQTAGEFSIINSTCRINGGGGLTEYDVTQNLQGIFQQEVVQKLLPYMSVTLYDFEPRNRDQLLIADLYQQRNVLIPLSLALIVLAGIIIYYIVPGARRGRLRLIGLGLLAVTALFVIVSASMFMSLRSFEGFKAYPEGVNSLMLNIISASSDGIAGAFISDAMLFSLAFAVIGLIFTLLGDRNSQTQEKPSQS